MRARVPGLRNGPVVLAHELQVFYVRVRVAERVSNLVQQDGEQAHSPTAAVDAPAGACGVDVDVDRGTDSQAHEARRQISDREPGRVEPRERRRINEHRGPVRLRLLGDRSEHRLVKRHRRVRA